MYAGKESILEVADMVVQMPRGGALGEWFGGPAAVSAEVEAMWAVEYYSAVSVAAKPKKVKPREYPVGLRDAKVKADRAVQMAAKFRRKHRVSHG